jgi:ABC-type transport system involved in cytochrome c biogenesis permease component
MHVRGILTFALGGVILSILWFMMRYSIEGANLFFITIILGFLGFLFIGIGLSAIAEDTGKSAK